MNVEINYLAIFIAAASSMVVGAVWYSQGVFGRAWARLAKVRMNKKPSNGEMLRLLGLTFVASLMTAYVLAHVAFLGNSYFQNSFLQDTLSAGFWLWLGFTIARILTHDIFEGRPSKLTLLTAGNELLTVIVMALVIGLMGV